MRDNCEGTRIIGFLECCNQILDSELTLLPSGCEVEDIWLPDWGIAIKRAITLRYRV